MDDKLSKIQNHLEFLGYKIDEKDNYILAESNGNLILIQKLSYAILHKIIWPMKKDADDNFFKILNSLNESTTISAYSTYKPWDDNEYALIVEAFYSGEYSKTSYGRFIEAFIVDNDEKIYNNYELFKYFE